LIDFAAQQHLGSKPLRIEEHTSEDSISPNKNAGFPHFFSCNFFSGVVIFASQKSPVFAGSTEGRPKQGYLFGRCTTPRPYPRGGGCSPQLLKAYADTEIKLKKEDTSNHAKQKDVEDAAYDRTG
jgi:hypothetical protein